MHTNDVMKNLRWPATASNARMLRWHATFLLPSWMNSISIANVKVSRSWTIMALTPLTPTCPSMMLSSSLSTDEATLKDAKSDLSCALGPDASEATTGATDFGSRTRKTGLSLVQNPKAAQLSMMVTDLHQSIRG